MRPYPPAAFNTKPSASLGAAHSHERAGFEPQIQSHPRMWEDPASVSGEEMTFTDS